MHDANNSPLIERRLSRRFEARKVVEGALVGLFAGIVVTLYRVVLSASERLLRHVVASGDGPIYLGIHALMLAALLWAVVMLLRWEPDAFGSGIPQTEGEVAGIRDMCWWRVVITKFLGGAATTLAGLSLGREGPSVQLGGMCGKAVARILSKERGEERLLVTCGAASGMSAAFGSPLTGVMFAFEEIHHVMAGPLVVSVMFASVLADFVATRVLGFAPVLLFPLAGELPLGLYHVIACMGVACGLMGAIHNEGMRIASEAARKASNGHPKAIIAVAFVLAGILAHAYPQVTCGGDAIIDILELGRTPLGMLCALLAGKFLFTCLCFGSKAPGGTLFPMVAMGALMGLIWGELTQAALGMDASLCNYFVVLGIVGLFSGAVRAPVTAVVLAFELTGSLSTLLAATLVSVTAYVTSEITGTKPFYERLYAEMALEAREAEESATMIALHNVRTHVIEPGSPVEGKHIADVDWPEGTHIIDVSRGGVDVLPIGETVLYARDVILVSMRVEGEARTQQIMTELVSSRIGMKQ